VSERVMSQIARYQQWLERQPVASPMTGLLWEPDIPPHPQFIQTVGIGREVLPEHIRPDHFMPQVEQWHTQATQFPGDLIQRFTPAFGIPWMEAIAGCRVMAHPGSLWAEACLEDIHDRRPICFDPGNPWFMKLIEFTREMVRSARGRFPVAAPQIRGPLDVLAALRTPEQMCIDLLESPDAAASLLCELTDLWIEIGRAVLAILPSFSGGYMARMGSWAPEPILTLQNDVSTMLSPDIFRELVLPCDRRIVEAFPRTEYHVHGSEYHQIENLLTLDRLTTIEFTLEHTLGGAPLETTLPVIRRMLDRRPVLLAALDTETADRCVRELPARGLCVMLASSSNNMPAPFIQWIGQHESGGGGWN